MIKVKDVTMSYGKKKILDQITFQVNKGDIVGLLGKNGEGKSTTMNILTGYLTPQQGEVWISDIDMRKEPRLAKQKIGYLPEIPPLYKDMKVIEYLEFAARLKKVDSVTSEVERVMDLFDLYEKRFEFIKILSKGWQQRVGFAQCLIGNPEILILDEPLVGLDPNESKLIRSMIKNLSEDHTIVISSHILREIDELCSKILMIKNGKIVLDDSLNHAKNKQVKNQYRLIVKGQKENILQLLLQSDLLSEVKYVKEPESGVYEFVVSSRQKQDIRDNLFGFLVGKKVSVYGIERMENTLEDIFLELNDEEDNKC